MPIKDYIQSVTRVRIRDLLEGPAVILGRSLPFNMQMQTQTNWCWAATATSVSLFYNSSSSWTQCTVANAELGLASCCTSPVPGACNVPWFLNQALDRTDNYVSFSGPMSFADIREQIRQGRPVGARIGWAGGGGHFMVIYGWSRFAGTEYLLIDDPIFGKTEPTLATFTSSYQGSGSWTHTYLTKKAPSVFEIQPIPIPELLPELLRRHPFPDPPPELESDGRLGLALPHRVYALGLRDLVDSNAVERAQRGVRVFQVAGGRPIGFVDVEGEDGREVASTSSSDAYPRAFEAALAAAERSEAGGEVSFEPRLLRVPALYTEVLWLHRSAGEDKAVVISSPHALPKNEAVPLERLLEQLRELAAAQLRLYEDDDDGLKGS